MERFSHVQPIQIDTEYITPSESSKCLGVVWMHNLSPKGSITLNINKARGAFFALGSLDNGQRKPKPTHSW